MKTMAIFFAVPQISTATPKATTGRPHAPHAGSPTEWDSGQWGGASGGPAHRHPTRACLPPLDGAAGRNGTADCSTERMNSRGHVWFEGPQDGGMMPSSVGEAASRDIAASVSHSRLGVESQGGERERSRKRLFDHCWKSWVLSLGDRRR